VAAAIFLLLITLFRFWYSAVHELVQDEAYYWQWSRHLAWGYYDNTPLIAPVIRVFTSLFGDTQLGVRAGAVVCSAVVSIFIYLIARRLCSPLIAITAFVVAQAMPLFAFGSMLMTQDPLQLAFWGATLYVVLSALEGPGWLWLVAGFLAGITVMAKFNGWLIVPSIFLFLVLDPEYRKKWLVRPEPYFATVIAFLVFLPFVWWNHTHSDVFWHHILSVGSRSSEHDGLKWFWRFLGDQAVELSPLLLLVYLHTLWPEKAGSDPNANRAFRFLWAPTVTVFLSIAIVSLRSKVEGNWAAAGYITGVILIARLLVRLWDTRRAYWGVFVTVSLLISMVMSVSGLFPNLLYSVGVKMQKPRLDRTNEVYGWPELADRAAMEQKAIGGKTFFFGVNYRIPSEMSFYTPSHPATYCFVLYDRPTEYMFWQDLQHNLIGDNAVYMNDSDKPDHIDRLDQVFRRVEVQPPLLIYRDPPYGRVPIRIIQVYRCYGFKGYDQAVWQRGW
jgi:4-amino-4-deoxy-L-arabinose transferase-like glycosyltransferase